MSPATTLVLAAGQGTRMVSDRPKALHDLCGRPMVMWPVAAALEAGAGSIVVVAGPGMDLAGVLPEGVRVAVQGRPDGTGGAVAAGLAELDGKLDTSAPVLVLIADAPLIDGKAIASLLQAHAEAGAAATMMTARPSDPSGYGRVVRDGDGRVLRVAETKADGDSTVAEREIGEVNTGIFVFEPYALLQSLPELGTDNAQGELYLPQVIEVMSGAGVAVATCELSDPALMAGVNDRVALAAVRRRAQDEILRRHMLAGVTIVDPASTVVDVGVEIGQDTVIEPFTTLRGSTRIGRDCVVRHSYLVDCELEDGVSVGPFAYLRPATVMRSGSKAGSFVELKNSDIGERSKVPHLSYIGDARVGAGTNLGAATITANYDGRNKHRTTVGAGVRTGVDTTLVAPVELGDGAVTGAGSVITEDVPGAALGIARARQKNIEGYAGRPPAEGK